MNIIAVLFFVLLLNGQALAQSENPDLIGSTSLVYGENDNPASWCRSGHFPGLSNEYQLGLINKKTRFIYDDDSKVENACPSEDLKQCPARKFIKAKTSVVVSKPFKDYYCVYNPRNSSSAWVHKNSLDIVQPKGITASSWIGHWMDGQNTLNITQDASGLKVSGTAVWIGNVEDGSVHTGELDFVAQPLGNKLILPASEQGDCSAELIHLEKYLVVRDNSNCGGMNVRFNGVYRRK